MDALTLSRALGLVAPGSPRGERLSCSWATSPAAWAPINELTEEQLKKVPGDWEEDLMPRSQLHH